LKGGKKMIAKIFPIFIIALFIGASFPVIGCEKEAEILTEITFYRGDGKVTTEKIKLNKEDIRRLEWISAALQEGEDEEEIKKNLLFFLGRYDFLEKFPLYFIYSAGVGRKILTPYHGEMRVKKFFATWHYPTQFGSTIILGNRMFTPPIRILLGRQVGFVVGFVGLYIYVPPILPQLSSKTFLIGSAAYAWGIAY
jgi:hypothetical protein